MTQFTTKKYGTIFHGSYKLNPEFGHKTPAGKPLTARKLDIKKWLAAERAKKRRARAQVLAAAKKGKKHLSTLHPIKKTSGAQSIPLVH